jgi:tetratricopeptide (TPR) repeat protein
MGAAEKRIADSLDVKGYPTFLLLPAGHSAPVRCSMYRADTAPFELLSPQEFIDRIEDKNRRHFKKLVADGERRRSEGDLAGALEALDKAAAAGPDDPDVYLERGKAHEQGGDLDKALADYAAVAALRPDDASVYERATRALREERRFDEAVACATGWLARDARNGRAFLARAEAHQGRGDPMGARQDAQHACALGASTGCRWTGAAK